MRTARGPAPACVLAIALLATVAPAHAEPIDFPGLGAGPPGFVGADLNVPGGTGLSAFAGTGLSALATVWPSVAGSEFGSGLTRPTPVATGGLPAGTTAHVDGVSDQNLQSADPYFSAFFYDSWVETLPPHITISRYVVQWNVLSGKYPAYLAKYEAWYAATTALGLTPELAVTSYDGVLPKSSAEYRREIARLLDLKAVSYFEAWNEPNNRPFISEAAAAHFTNSAYALCRRRACTVIAGDLLDSPNMVGYEIRYEKNLTPPVPRNWGIHPYYAVKAENEATVAGFRANLPHSDEEIWFTEVGAYDCVHGEHAGELQQAIDASWLADRLIPAIRPAHVAYYDYLDSNPPSCGGSEADTSLYRSGADPNAPDHPRPAAPYIFNGRGVPSAYTGAPADISAASATVTGSVYPGGFLDTRYHFEYGPTTTYGSYSGERDAGSGSRGVPAGAAVARLLPDTTYHYRLVAWNAEGTSEEGPGVGSDQTFHTGD